MLEGNDAKPGIEEQYQRAGNTSDLTVEADRRGAGDVMIAAGWSQSRVGMALLRLHSEWDAMAKPKRATREQVEALARSYADKRGKPDVTRASAEAQGWYANELRLMANGLKSRPAVWEQIGQWIALKGISPDLAAEALLFWLDPNCRVCDGHGLRKVPNQPALSARQCHKCHGTGHVPHPHGSAKLLSWMDDCVQKARESLKKRLRPGG